MVWDADLKYFVAGGTMPIGAASYLERAADRELFEALLAGEFCYVLNSRQMGKSSLAVRTVARLTDVGIRTGFVDLTRLGGATVSADQWYSGLLLEIGRAIGLRTEAAEWIKSHREIGAAQRLFSFLNEVALARDEQAVVVMVDEIDAVRSLPFSTDELFAGFRQLYNGRADDPSLRRLTICLLGAALPSDLIQDPRSTPFNIGRRIELRDLTHEEAMPFVEEVGGAKELDRLLYWSGGHPFLTQALGMEIASGKQDIDRLVRDRYLDDRATETDTNLSDVGRRLLGEGDPNVGEKERADTLSLFGKLLKGGIQDDESNTATARIKMSGVARLENGRLTIRNRIYERVFDNDWIRKNLPDQEVRRQKRAFLVGALRTASLAAVVIATVSVLAWRNYNLASEEARARQSAEYELYAARMMLVGDAWNHNDLDRVKAILEQTKTSQFRGLEWNVWSSIVDQSLRFSSDEKLWSNMPDISPDGSKIVISGLGWIRVRNAFTGSLISEVKGCENPSIGFLSNDVVLATDMDENFGFRPRDGRILWKRPINDFDPVSHKIDQRTTPTFFAGVQKNGKFCVREYSGLTGLWVGRQSSFVTSNDLWSQIGKHSILVPRLHGALWDGFIVDFATGKVRSLSTLGLPQAAMSTDGRRFAIARSDRTIEVRDTETLAVVAKYKPELDPINELSLSEDGSLLGVAFRTLRADLIDLKSGTKIQRFLGTSSLAMSKRTRSVLTAYRALRVYNLAAHSKNSIEIPRRVWHWIQPQNNGSITLLGSNTRANLTFGNPNRHLITDFKGNPFSWECTYPGPSVLQTGSKSALLLAGDGHTVLSKLKLPIEISNGTLSADGTTIAVTNETGKVVEIFRLGESIPRRKVVFNKVVNSIVFDPTGKNISVNLMDGSVVLLNVATGRERWFTRHDFRPNNTRFSGSGNYMITSGDDNEAIFHNLITGKSIKLEGHSARVGGADISPDHTRAITTAEDESVIIWDTGTGRALTRIRLDRPEDVRFIDSGKRVAIITRYAVLIWNCVSQESR